MNITSHPPLAFQTHPQIRDQFAQMRRSAHARHRDIALKLNITEGELIAAHVMDSGSADEGTEPLLKVRRLRAAWPDIITALECVGEVMALTRNGACVHEKVGIYNNSSHMGAHGNMGMVLGGAIDLRIFYNHWAHGFAVFEATEKGPQRSLQFFDAAGGAVHKVFLRPASNLVAWEDLIAAFVADDQVTGMSVAAQAEPAAELSDSGIDVPALRESWASMRDTHEFFGVLKKHKVSRLQALRLADPQFVQRVDADAVHLTLTAAAREAVPIMVFVGNPGMIQIHSGVVKRVAVMGPWLNVLDDGFNLHLRDDHISSAWVVFKPTSDGLVTSLELFDARGDTIAMFFGERKPGRPELELWRALIANVLTEATPCAA